MFDKSRVILTHPDCEVHAMPRHPERPERLSAVMNQIHESGISRSFPCIDADEIKFEDLLSIHPESYVRHIEASEPDSDVIKVDPDTYMTKGSTRAARLAAGAVAEATRIVLAGGVSRAFCAIRPPGHHTELAEAFGFCLFNNVAIGAAVALSTPGIERVAILDFDVHHCNGTVDIFKDDPRVLVCSSFQDHFYPNRFLDFSNDHIITTPLESGTASTPFRKAIEASWLPAIERHKPDLIFISAGFDAHKDDPLGELQLTEDDYTWITKLITDMADHYAYGRVVSTLEGGYDLTALANSVEAHLKALF